MNTIEMSEHAEALRPAAGRVELGPPYRHDDQFAWTVELPADLQGDAAKRNPPLILYEDERRLSPAGAMQAEIRRTGAGAHAFWHKHLCFSASDSSDPNTNGRRYAICQDVDLKKNYRDMAPEAEANFRQFIIETMFSKTVRMPDGAVLTREQYLETPQGQKSLADNLHARLDHDRSTIVPWLNETRPLVGLRILEIGCGTGSSSLALAEQGAHVVGVDIHSGALHIAEQRCHHYGIDAVEFHQANAADLPAEIASQSFDFIIFFASLEHMTYDERLKSLADCWRMLPTDRFLCCTATPNRLWHVDGHTSHLPFYHWLPDELAIRYAKFSPELSLRRALGDFMPTPEKTERLIRAGRGLSFHEFELAIGPVADLSVVSCLNKTLVSRLSSGQKRDDDDFICALMAHAPGAHPAWFFPRIDIVIQKT
jgi:S-adenosylmethionine-dependent methyltransferase